MTLFMVHSDGESGTVIEAGPVGVEEELKQRLVAQGWREVEEDEYIELQQKWERTQ